MSEYGTMRFDGRATNPDLGGSSHTGGGLGDYSGGSNPGRRPLDDEQIAQLFKQYQKLKKHNQETPKFDVTSDWSVIYCISLIILIILGLVLNFIFLFDLWMIALILVVLLIVIGIIATIFN